MKKIISVLMVLAIIFAFAGCSQKDEPANDETISQSDSENLTTQPVKVEDDTTGGKQDSSDASEPSTDKKTTEKTTKAKEKEKTTKATTAKKEETTAKRKIKLNVKFPYYNGAETIVKIEYKADGDKKYTSLFDEDDDKAKITLDKAKTVSYDIDKKIAGDVDIRITLDGIGLLKNDFVVSGKDNEATIEVVTSSEMLDGGMD